MKEKTAETLPPGWKRVRLGDVCIEDKLIISGSESGLPYLGLEMIQSKTGIINWESSELDSKGTCFYFDERHVLYSKLRPYLNKVALPNKKGKCTTELIPLFPNQDVCREYLALLLRRNETVEYAMKEKTGSRMPRVNMTHLFNMIIPLPPLDEQKRIAESIEKKLQAVEKVKNAVKDELAYVEELSASILHQELTGGGGGKLPAGWRIVKLSDVGEIRMCKRIFKEQTSPSGDIPFYKIGTFGKEADAYISAELYNEYKNKYPFPKSGDVLISAAGTIGRAIVYDGKPAYYQDSNIVWIDNDETKIINNYLYYCFQNVHWENEQTDCAIISRLYNYNLKNIQVIIPPLSEQKHIADIIQKKYEAIKNLNTLLKTQLAFTTALSPSFLRQAFRGEF